MLPLTPARIKALYDEALKLQQAGRPDEAAERHRAILAARPRTTESHYQLGRIALARHDGAAALDHLDRARRIKPAEAAIWREMARAHAALGRARDIARFRDEARRSALPPSRVVALDKVLGRDPALPRGRDLPGDLEPVANLMRQDRPDRAARLAWAILAAGPSEPAPVLHALATAQRALGHLDAADAALREAIGHAPDSDRIRVEHAELRMHREGPNRALAALEPVLKRDDPPAAALFLQGRALMARGANRPAVAVLERALGLAPEWIELRCALAHALRANDRDDEALAVADAGPADAARAGALHLARAQALEALGREDEARAAFDLAVTHSPDRALALSERAVFLQTLGEFDAAERDFRAALAANPRYGSTYRTFLSTYRVSRDDPLLAQMERVFADDTLEPQNRVELGFALARAMEQTKQYDRVFSYLRPANEIVFRRAPYDIAERRRDLDEVGHIFDGADLSAPVAGASDAAPIFVTGMPRSGTTLIEQILASHSQVEGAGEVGVLRRALQSLTHRPDGVRRLADIPAADLAALGRSVDDRHRAIRPDAARVTDKSIMTYMVMGAVRVALPNARIVLVRRDPCDVALSIYKNMFAEGLHRYAYDLRTLGLYVAMFEEMVDYWRERLPGGFHEIGYEALLDDPEGETRRLLAACDLDWEDACLSFHETKRRVSTLSVGQVRQPLYRSSVRAWHRHEADLAPFIEALDEGRRARHAA